MTPKQTSPPEPPQVRVRNAVNQTSAALIYYIMTQGGKVTSRQLQRSGPRYRNAKLAMNALRKLVVAGVGKFEYRSLGLRGGRPSVFFTMTKSAIPDRFTGKCQFERALTAVCCDSCWMNRFAKDLLVLTKAHQSSFPDTAPREILDLMKHLQAKL